MRTFAIFPAIALTALTLTGCVQDKPAPRLDSTDRDERIEAVRVAQNRYGVRPTPAAPQPTGDAAALVGRWNNVQGNTGDFLFYADGTCGILFPLSGLEGTWRLLSAGTIEFRMPGETVYTAKYRLSGDTLELDLGSGWIAYIKDRTENQP